MSGLFVQESSTPTAIPAVAKPNTTPGSIPKMAKPGVKPPAFAPLSRLPRSTMTANIEMKESPVSLLEEDIELIEESGLLEIEEEAIEAKSESNIAALSDSSSSSEDTEHIVELTQSILIDDVEGNPNAVKKAPIRLAPEALDEEIILADEILSEEEIAAKAEFKLPDDNSDTRVVAMSEIEEVTDIEEPVSAKKPQAQRQVTTTAVIATVDALAGLPEVPSKTPHEEAVASGLAQYSDGKPNHLLVNQRAGTAKTNRSWSRIAIPAIVFIAGISGGILLASQSGTSSESAAATPAPQVQSAPVAPQVAPLAQIEVAQIEVAPLVVEELVVEELVPEAQPDIVEEAIVPDNTLTPVIPDEPVAAIVAAEETAVVTAEAKSHLVPDKAAKVQPKPVTKPAIVAKKPVTKPVIVTKRPVRKPAIVTKKPAKATQSSDPGVLMLGAKPPSSIIIDGKATGLKTPQRSLKLSPGTHKITLVNKDHGIRDTFSVTVKSGKTVKRIRNNTNKIK